MKSWVRYSVAVYVGLLFAGSLMTSQHATAITYRCEPLNPLVIAASRYHPAPEAAQPSTPDKNSGQRDKAGRAS